MSKAFTKETDVEELEPDEGPALPAGVKNYITPEGMARLRAELKELRTVERPKIVDIVAWAAGNGDRSENGDYIYGKKRLREIDSRVRFLSKRLDDMTVVDRPPEDSSRVFFGAWVELENEQGDTVVYRIVGPDETDMDRRFISVDAPVARALLKKQSGDEAEVRTPQGTLTWFINRIWYDYD